MGRPRSGPDQFWARVDQSAGDDGCWPWTGCATRGYGILNYRGRKERAHRIAWTLANSPIPPDMIVCHKCDNPPCCNPGHLFLGTHADNAIDMSEKERGNLKRGIRNPNARLTPGAVIEMRRLYAAGSTTCSALARAYGVDRKTVSAVLRGRTWAGI